MPIYEYDCRGCGKTFEELILTRSSEDEVSCPACQSRAVERRISRPAAARSSAGEGAAPSPSCGPVG